MLAAEADLVSLLEAAKLLEWLPKNMRVTFHAILGVCHCESTF